MAVIKITLIRFFCLYASLTLCSYASDEKYDLNYHLSHPGTKAIPADPNAAICVDGVYHLHYICNPGGDVGKFDYAHVVSRDMLNWEWKPTSLTQCATADKMFSGTAFPTKDGRVAVIYQGAGNVIAVAKDKSLERWENPYRVLPENPKGFDQNIFRHWDPDCFRVGDTYYAIFGNLYFDLDKVPFLSKSTDLKNWEYVGPFMSCEADDVLTNEDVSCANFFKLGNKWMLLCISHMNGARYYLGEWDKRREQFVPEFHARLAGRPVYNTAPSCKIFAPESLLTPDGRRVAWFWIADCGAPFGVDGVQSLPRELSLSDEGRLLMQPIRELCGLRFGERTYRNFKISPIGENSWKAEYEYLFDLPSDSAEISIEIPRAEAEHNRIGFNLFSDGKNDPGLPLLFCADTKTFRFGNSEWPFEMKQIPADENLKIRIFVDKFLVEVFVNDRIAMAAAGKNFERRGLYAQKFKCPYSIKEIKVWQLKPANAGFKTARANGIVK